MLGKEPFWPSQQRPSIWHLPVAIGIIMQLQQAVLGIVAFAAAWAYKIPAPVGPFMVVSSDTKKLWPQLHGII